MALIDVDLILSSCLLKVICWFMLWIVWFSRRRMHRHCRRIRRSFCGIPRIEHNALSGKIRKHGICYDSWPRSCKWEWRCIWKWRSKQTLCWDVDYADLLWGFSSIVSLLSFCGILKLEGMLWDLTLGFLFSRSGLIVALIVSQHSYSCGEWFDSILNTHYFSQFRRSLLYAFPIAFRSEACPSAFDRVVENGFIAERRKSVLSWWHTAVRVP